VFQSTRPRGARHGVDALDPVLGVSIHAPAGGATQPGTDVGNGDRFNPRARGGRDGKADPIPPRGMVSIHAPAGGATSWHALAVDKHCFNPRARGGRDPASLPPVQV